MQKYRAKLSTLFPRYNIIVCLWYYHIIIIIIYLLIRFIYLMMYRTRFTFPVLTTHYQYYLIDLGRKIKKNIFIYMNTFLNLFETITLIFLRIFPDLKILSILYDKNIKLLWISFINVSLLGKKMKEYKLFWLSLTWERNVQSFSVYLHTVI